MTTDQTPHRRVTLTFDDGPTPGVTERVVEILDRHHVTARFFVVGEKVAEPAADGPSSGRSPPDTSSVRTRGATPYRPVSSPPPTSPAGTGV